MGLLAQGVKRAGSTLASGESFFYAACAFGYSMFPSFPVVLYFTPRATDAAGRLSIVASPEIILPSIAGGSFLALTELGIKSYLDARSAAQNVASEPVLKEEVPSQLETTVKSQNPPQRSSLRSTLLGYLGLKTAA